MDRHSASASDAKVVTDNQVTQPQSTKGQTQTSVGDGDTQQQSQGNSGGTNTQQQSSGDNSPNITLGPGARATFGPQSERPKASIVTNAGKIDELQITNSDVTNQPSGTAAILDNNPGSQTSKVKIDNSHVLSPPANNNPPADGSLVHVGSAGAAWIVEKNNISCNPALQNDGKVGSAVVDGNIVNDPKHCAWIAVVDMFLDHRTNIASFIDNKWKPAEEEAWKNLSDSQKATNRNEFNALRTKVVNECGTDWGCFEMTHEMFPHPPNFDIKLPSQ
jgi:hypothetical protein